MKDITETTSERTTEVSEGGSTTLKAERIQATATIDVDRRPAGGGRQGETETERDRGREAGWRRRRCA